MCHSLQEVIAVVSPKHKYICENMYVHTDSYTLCLRVSIDVHDIIDVIYIYTSNVYVCIQIK